MAPPHSRGRRETGKGCGDRRAPEPSAPATSNRLLDRPPFQKRRLILGPQGIVSQPRNHSAELSEMLPAAFAGIDVTLQLGGFGRGELAVEVLREALGPGVGHRVLPPPSSPRRAERPRCNRILDALSPIPSNPPISWWV